MRKMKRLALAGALCALATSTSGCGFLYLLDELRHPRPRFSSLDATPSTAKAGADEGAGAARAAASHRASAVERAASASRAREAGSAKAFRVRFRGVTVGDPTAYLSDDGVIAQGVARGRFDGVLAGSRLGPRFSVGRWKAQSELTYDPATKTATGVGAVLLHFRDRRAGSACLLVTVTKAREKNGALAESGTVTALSGSGLGARLAGTARFSSRAGDHRGRLRGRSRIVLTNQRSESRFCPGLSDY